MSLHVEGMPENELEFFTIHDKAYVMPFHAAQWLKMPLAKLAEHIILGQLELVDIEGHDYIEVEALKAYAAKRKLKAI